MYQAHMKDSAAAIPVGKIVCLGRNYVDHIHELGNEIPTSPVLFIKPATSIIHSGERIVIPPISSDCHHEIELAVLIGKQGSKVGEEQAMELVAGYGVAIDLTLRDVQARQKEKGLPWEIAKAFDTACPLSDFVPAAQVGDPHDVQLTLTVNGEVRQDASSALMMRRIPQIISEISQLFTLLPGDILLTGTPAGVSALHSGDVVRASISRVGELEVTVA